MPVQHQTLVFAVFVLISIAGPSNEALSFETIQMKGQTDPNEPDANTEDLDSDFKVDPDASALNLTRLGAEAMSTGEPDKAVALFEAAMNKDPESAMTRNNFAFALLNCSKPDPERALQILDEGLASMPRGPSKYRSNFQDTRGNALMQLERFEDAIAALELALIDRPDNLEILDALVKCYDQIELDGTGYVERIEELKNSTTKNTDKGDAEPKPDAEKDEYLQAIESDDPEVVFDALTKANDWPRTAEVPVRISENRKRVHLADRLLGLGEPASNHRAFAIDSKIEALAAIYGLDLFYNLGDKEIGKELRDCCRQFADDADVLVQRNARLGLLKYYVFEHIKNNADQEADAAKAEMLEVLKRFPNDDVCLDTVGLILKSAARLKKPFRIELIEFLQSNIDQFKGTATENFILDIDAIESAQ